MQAPPTTPANREAAPGASHRRFVRHLDLFSGIGGFALAARMAGGIETVGFCEIDPWAQKVLAKNFPGVPIHDDVKTLEGNEHGTIELITGGYPSQPFSLAGERRGEEDDRHLWPEVLRITQRCQPRWLLCENVAGHITMGLDKVLSDLARIGYTSQPVIIPACAVGAHHRRDRVWIIANSDREGLPQRSRIYPRTTRENSGAVFAGIDTGHGKPGMGRAVHGIPGRVDRLRGLGNAIVPQVAAEILRAMMGVDSLTNILNHQSSML